MRSYPSWEVLILYFLLRVDASENTDHHNAHGDHETPEDSHWVCLDCCPRRKLMLEVGTDSSIFDEHFAGNGRIGCFDMIRQTRFVVDIGHVSIVSMSFPGAKNERVRMGDFGGDRNSKSLISKSGEATALRDDQRNVPNFWVSQSLYTVEFCTLSEQCRPISKEFLVARGRADPSLYVPHGDNLEINMSGDGVRIVTAFDRDETYLIGWHSVILSYRQKWDVGRKASCFYAALKLGFLLTLRRENVLIGLM